MQQTSVRGWKQRSRGASSESNATRKDSPWVGVSYHRKTRCVRLRFRISGHGISKQKGINGTDEDKAEAAVSTCVTHGVDSEVDNAAFEAMDLATFFT